ncbi:MAG: hypothetical protein HC880_18285 [Bacteroidia bacterium]|nr:hypothetical protein [Bacteroidia bacterium]
MVKISPQNYQIYHHPSRRLIRTIDRSHPKNGISAEQTVAQVLEHIARWENFWNLENPQARIALSDIALDFFEIDAQGNEYAHPGSQIILDIPFKSAKWQPVSYRTEVENKHRAACILPCFL